MSNTKPREATGVGMSRLERATSAALVSCAMMLATSACRLPTEAQPESLVTADAGQDAAAPRASATGGAGGVAPIVDAGGRGGTGGVSPGLPATDAALSRDGGAMTRPPPRPNRSADASAPQAGDASIGDAGQIPQECTPELAFDFATCLATDPFNPDCITHAGPCAGLERPGDAATAGDGG